MRIRPVLPDDHGFVIAAARRLASFGPPAWRPSEDIVNGEARTLEGFFAAPSAAQGRGLVATAAALFVVSTVFPGAASVLELERPPRWAGVADAIVAFVVVGLGIAVASRKPAGFDARASRSALHLYR